MREKIKGQQSETYEFAVEMRVAEVFYVFGQVAEQENVLVACFAGDFDLDTGLDTGNKTCERQLGRTHVCTVTCANDQTSI